jgi:LacI family transcriptional regulator, galactose operon repressor
MKTAGPITIGDIMAATGLSRATIDRVLNNRSGVHPRTRAHVLRVLSQLEDGPVLRSPGEGGRSPDGQANVDSATRFKFGLVVQAGQAFTQSLLNEAQRLAHTRLSDATFDGFASRSDDETVDLIRSVGSDRNGIAVVAKNIEPVRSAIQELRTAGEPVVALVSDLNPHSRSAYVGIDNRAAGQVAGFILGRCLERAVNPMVAVVVGNFSYRCHEDREIGFRSLLRQRFPEVEIVEVIKGDDSREATYEAAYRFLKNRKDVAGIYNLAGGNQGLARALQECEFIRPPLYITHELNEVTEPLLRSGVIDFLITQSMEALVRLAKQCLIGLILGTSTVREANYLPVQIISEFNIPSFSWPPATSGPD